MKTKVSIVILFLIVSLSNNLSSQSPTKVKLYSLQPNESLVYGENCFPTTDNANELFLVTQLNGSYYIYENGKRRGPISKLSADMIRSCPRIEKGCGAFDPTSNNEENIFEKYLSQQDDGLAIINFNGKKYGPYYQVYDMQLSLDKSKFAATVSDPNKNKYVVMSIGKTIALTGLPNKLYLSPDGNIAIVRYGLDYDVDNFDASKINMETAVQVNVLTSDGAKYGPFNGDDFRDYYIWFCKTTPNHWIMKQGENYLLDGKTPLNIPTSAYNCDIWLTPDGKRYAYSNYEKIQFSDNTSIVFPFEFTVTEKDGKLFFRCISIENDRDIYVCTKAL